MSPVDSRQAGSTDHADSKQTTRLYNILKKNDLEPDRYLPGLIDSALAKVSDSELEALVLQIVRSNNASTAANSQVSTSVHVEETFQRFNLTTRLQHGMMAISIVILILTGLPIKYHEAAFSGWLIELMGGIEVSSLIHRIGATGLILVGIVHLFYITATRAGRSDFIKLLPQPKDLFDWIQMLKYYFHRTDIKAKFGRFSYIEKFDYWAVYWGMIIMISSGSLLWFETEALKFVPKYMMDIATEAHSDEALLATLAIVIWHFYNVHFTPAKFPVSKVFIHGRLTREEMEDEHPLELEEILVERKRQNEKTSAKKRVNS